MLDKTSSTWDQPQAKSKSNNRILLSNRCLPKTKCIANNNREVKTPMDNLDRIFSNNSSNKTNNNSILVAKATSTCKTLDSLAWAANKIPTSTIRWWTTKATRITITNRTNSRVRTNKACSNTCNSIRTSSNSSSNYNSSNSNKIIPRTTSRTAINKSITTILTTRAQTSS